MAFDAKKEPVAFYGRHFDGLVEVCLEASSMKYRLSPLNALPLEERRQWVRVGFREIIRYMVSDGTDEAPATKALIERVYFPRVSELGDAPFFGIGWECDLESPVTEGVLPQPAWDTVAGRSWINQSLDASVMERYPPVTRGIQGGGCYGDTRALSEPNYHNF